MFALLRVKNEIVRNAVLGALGKLPSQRLPLVSLPEFGPRTSLLAYGVLTN